MKQNNTLRNPFANLNRFEWGLFLISLFVVTVPSLISGSSSLLTITNSIIGVTALIFLAKGDVFGQLLVVLFSVFYGIISLQTHYYGEMITYMGMTAPMAIASAISWLKHPAKGDGHEVEIAHLNKRIWGQVILFTVVVTGIFYFILKALHTAQLPISTLSVATSFFAVYLTFLRSPFYALGYAANDLVLIALWILASIKNPSYLSTVLCFVMFLINDLYGFYSWQKRKKLQAKK